MARWKSEMVCDQFFGKYDFLRDKNTVEHYAVGVYARDPFLLCLPLSIRTNLWIHLQCENFHLHLNISLNLSVTIT